MRAWRHGPKTVGPDDEFQGEAYLVQLVALSSALLTLIPLGGYTGLRASAHLGVSLRGRQGLYLQIKDSIKLKCDLNNLHLGI